MTNNSNQNALLASIEKDIEESRKSAKHFLDLSFGVLWAGIAFLFIYIVPEIAATHLPAAEARSREVIQTFNTNVERWEKKFGGKYEYFSDEYFAEKSRHGLLTEADIALREIKYPHESVRLEMIARSLSNFRLDSTKLESMIKVIPVFLGALFAGFLLTHRFHAQAAIDLAREKYKILERASDESTVSSQSDLTRSDTT